MTQIWLSEVLSMDIYTGKEFQILVPELCRCLCVGTWNVVITWKWTGRPRGTKNVGVDPGSTPVLHSQFCIYIVVHFLCSSKLQNDSKDETKKQKNKTIRPNPQSICPFHANFRGIHMPHHNTVPAPYTDLCTYASTTWE